MNNDTLTHEQNVLTSEDDWVLGIPNANVNATGLLAEDLEDAGLTEIQTVILACIATIIPLFLGLLLILGVRMMWKKYKHHSTNNGYDNNGLRREDSCDAVKSSSFMQSAEELKTSESQYSVLMPDETCCYAAPQPLYNSPPNNRFGDTNKTNLNGSIITLTMKNNHLIVETEERVPGVCTVATAAVEAGEQKSMDYEYDDDEFDLEAEMLRREFREASLMANGNGSCLDSTSTAVIAPSSETEVDPTTRPAGALQPQQHSSGGSSSADSRAPERAYAYGNQSEYSTGTIGKHKGTAKPITPSDHTDTVIPDEEEHLAEQRLLGNGVDALAENEDQNICSFNQVNGIATAVNSAE
ncbi:uncharacterized protein LOC126903735 [Daktulosphaira vitifoliae]|uniref:uncharacterized protein LOC126903735 n=1 Tax=Daktulosphaira vitifoliae TaxID=58002 RepID=UPI0021AA1745|nr:uncharacterized protein LOC126903735 [Daktulosphaira vitifoliae]